MHYLTLEQANKIIIKQGQCNYDEDLEDTLECLDTLIDEWLGYSARLLKYNCKYRPNYKGSIYLHHSPVVKILSVQYLIPQITLQPQQINKFDAAVLFDGKNHLDISGYCLGCNPRSTTFEVIYLAGYESIPKPFVLAAKKLLQRILIEGVESLLMPYKEIKSTKNPTVDGNLEITYQTTTLATGMTVLDSILNPLLSRYKKTLFYAD